MTCCIRNHKKLESPSSVWWLVLCSLCTVIFILSNYPVNAIPTNEDFSNPRVEDKYQQSWNDTWEDKLKQNLLAKYDKFARPAQHYNTTTVNVSLNVFSVNVDDKNNVMAVNVWNMMAWNDDKLKWNSAEYGGLKQISLGSHEVWLPDIYLLNSAAHGMEFYGDRHAVLQEDGIVMWVIPTIFHGYCNLDFMFWPFEMNICRLRLISWTYDGNQVNLLLDHQGVYLSEYLITSDWVVKNVTANRRVDTHKCCPDVPYVTLDFEFELSRSADLYYHVVFVPTFPIVFMVLITFWLRPQSETKLIINGCTILIVLIYLMYLGTKVPPRHDSMPLIVRFYSGCLYQATISLIISTILININKLAYYFTIPRTLTHILMGKSGRYLGLGQIIHEIEMQKSVSTQEIADDHLVDISMTAGLSNSQQMLTTPVPNTETINNLEWTLLATAVDRLVFIIFSLTFTIMSICYVRTKRFKFSSDNIPFWHH